MGYSKVDSLNKMLEYIKNYKDKESSYTIQWSLKESSGLNTSYFRAANLLSAIEKFYFERDINSTVVFSVVLSVIIPAASYVLGIKKLDHEKASVFECGFDPFGDSRQKFEIRFFLVAILFIIFDLEISFLFP